MDRFSTELYTFLKKNDVNSFLRQTLGVDDDENLSLKHKPMKLYCNFGCRSRQNCKRAVAIDRMHCAIPSALSQPYMTPYTRTASAAIPHHAKSTKRLSHIHLGSDGTAVTRQGPTHLSFRASQVRHFSVEPRIG